MPIYEYRCRNCSATFEVLVRNEGDAVCPECGSTALDKLLSAAVVLSGRTNRPPGRTCCCREEQCEATPCSTAEGCHCG